MVTTTNQYNPDYAVPPGWVLEEHLDAYSISHAEFARRCGRSAKLISEIISGKASLEPETALQFERVLGVDATIWLGIEADYQLYKAREKESERAAQRTAWVKRFPVNEMVKRGIFQKPESPSDAMSKLLTFFGVGTADAWDSRLGNAAYRHSPAFKSKDSTVEVWLRLGEIEAKQQNCADYNASQFKHAAQEIRELTCDPIDEAFKRTTELCNKAGVALVATRPFKNMPLSGAARWMSPKNPVIQLSLRHKTNDHFWFTFFHEAAHILLHSKKAIFLDEKSGVGADEEREADEWASNILIPRKDWESFVAGFRNSEGKISADKIVDFATRQGIAPGIVVGRLQYDRVLAWGSCLNNLKDKYEWGNAC